jgi:hypothetical protein
VGHVASVDFVRVTDVNDLRYNDDDRVLFGLAGGERKCGE